MKALTTLLALTALLALCPPAIAAEGTSIAGPIGGTDIRSAQLPPPGFYAGSLHLVAQSHDFFDNSNRRVPAFDQLGLTRTRHGPFFGYVPDVQVLGGSVGLLAVLPAGTECGRLLATTPKRCIVGIGDPYIEAQWSRFFGTVRHSQFPGALPILEGLTVSTGIGVVIPVGRYSADDATRQGLVIGNNIWGVAPHITFTYTSRPLLFDGTELSMKAYLNTYRENPDTRYQTGDVVNVDFALTERIGRFQLGLAGYYAFQISDDRVGGIAVPPDGRQGAAATLGGVIAYDMPEHQSSIKLKVLTTVLEKYSPASTGAVIGWVKRF